MSQQPSQPADADSISCPTCGTDCPPSALVCKNCATPLREINGDPSTTAIMSRPKLDSDDSDALNDPMRVWGQPGTSKFSSGSILYISVERVNTPITRYIRAGEPFIIGREDTAGLVETPDVNLSPYNATDRGVSRQHLRVYLDEGGDLYAEDLGSSNGTMLNGEELPPESPVQLHDGDELILGRMMLWFNF